MCPDSHREPFSAALCEQMAAKQFSKLFPLQINFSKQQMGALPAKDRFVYLSHSGVHRLCLLNPFSFLHPNIGIVPGLCQRIREQPVFLFSDPGG